MTLSPLHAAGWLGDLEQTEERCRRYLAELRWPEGICCPRCEARPITEIPARRRFYCRRCRHFFSITSGTVLHNCHLPIWKWFVAVELMLTRDDGVSAHRLMQLLGVSYKTAWFAEHRIRAALCNAQGVARPKRPGGGYSPAYEAERRWRLHQRGNADAFRATVLELLRAEPLPFASLVYSP